MIPPITVVMSEPSMTPAKISKLGKADQVSRRAKRASALLKLVSDPTRLQVIVILADGEQQVGAICERLGMSNPAVSHHLALMRCGGIITARRQGKHSFYSLTAGGEPLAILAGRLTGSF